MITAPTAARAALRLFPLAPGRTLRPARVLHPVLILALALALAGCGAQRPAPAAEVIAPEGARLAGLPFSPAVRAGNLIFLSGAIGTRPGTSELISEDVGEQTAQTLANIEAVLQAADAGLDDVVKCTVFLVDMGDYSAMNEAYARVWPGAPPARSTMAGTGLALGAKVEIECIAYAPTV